MHHCDFLVRSTGRFIHLILENVPNSQRPQSAGPMGRSRALLGFRVSELSFFRKVQTTFDQACATATDQNCCLRPPRIRCTIKLTQTSLPVLLTNESC